MKRWLAAEITQALREHTSVPEYGPSWSLTCEREREKGRDELERFSLCALKVALNVVD